jgi:hypothetical protein
MPKQQLKVSRAKRIFSWIHVNRLKIVLFAFFVILPIAFVTTLYIATYTTYKKVHFDNEVTAETSFIKTFVEMDEIEEFDFVFQWTELRNPKLSTITNELEGGYYKFQMHYTQKSGYQISNLKVTPVLQTMWTDMRSIGNPVVLITTPKNVQVNFNYELPVSPLWFVTVTDPILYLKLEYTYQTASTPIQKVVYISFNLSELTPDKVIPNS